MRTLRPMPVGALILSVLTIVAATLDKGVSVVLALGLTAVVFAVLAAGDA